MGHVPSEREYRQPVIFLGLQRVSHHYLEASVCQLLVGSGAVFVAKDGVRCRQPNFGGAVVHQGLGGLDDGGAGVHDVVVYQADFALYVGTMNFMHLHVTAVTLLGEERAFTTDSLGDTLHPLFTASVRANDDQLVELAGKLTFYPRHKDNVPRQMVRGVFEANLNLISMHVERDDPFDFGVHLNHVENHLSRYRHARAIFAILPQEGNEGHHQRDTTCTRILECADGQNQRGDIMTGVAVEVIKQIDVLHPHVFLNLRQNFAA